MSMNTSCGICQLSRSEVVETVELVLDDGAGVGGGVVLLGSVVVQAASSVVQSSRVG